MSILTAGVPLLNPPFVLSKRNVVINQILSSHNDKSYSSKNAFGSYENTTFGKQI